MSAGEQIAHMFAACGITTECDNCGESSSTTRVRPEGGDSAMCDPCWRDALAHGHRHGLHTDGTFDEPVTDCPLCEAGQ